MFDLFETLNFPEFALLRSWTADYLKGAYVYVIFWAIDSGPEVPFYVGMTETNLRNRMWDYCEAQLAAPVDFWVGEAIKYLRDQKRCRITIRYRATTQPRKDEEDLIRELQVSGPRLLNGLRRHGYGSKEPEAERRFIHRYCDLITSSDCGNHPPPAPR
jgi:hypothetical protein